MLTWTPDFCPSNPPCRIELYKTVTLLPTFTTDTRILHDPFSEETREEHSEFMKNYYLTHKHPMFGRKQSKESIEKTRIANIGRKHSDEWNKKISESNKGHAGTRIPAVITEKKCNTCLETKPLNEFHKSRGQGGVRSTCKHCRSEAKKALPKKTRVPYLRTSEMREKISQSLMGHSVSEETRKKMSLKKIGVKRPDYKRRKQV